jgi:hypothetical protein
MTIRSKIWFAAAIAVLLAAAALLFNPAIGLYVDWLWFADTGYGFVFSKILFARLAVGIGSFIVIFGFLAANMRLAVKLDSPSKPVFDDEEISIGGMEILHERLKILLPLLAAFFAWFCSTTLSDMWPQALTLLNHSGFGTTDPVFGRDISFYIFALPQLSMLASWALGLTSLALAASAVLYLTGGNIRRSASRGVWFGPGAQAHLMALAALVFLAKGADYYIGRYGLLSQRGILLTGVAYTGDHIVLPAMLLLSMGCAAAAAVCAVYAARRSADFWKAPAACVAGIFLLAVCGLNILPELVQRLRVSPNEITLEKPYIKRNIDYTREAFSLGRITSRDFSTQDSLSASDITENKPTIDNIRLWDNKPLLASLGQLQSIRTYYDLASVDNDRYVIDGRYRQVMLSARELNYERLPSRIWINEHIMYTHGYGLVLGDVNEYSGEGMPSLLIKDIPPVTPPQFEIKRPQIYFGELSNDYILTNTKLNALDYPSGDKNVYGEYDGKAGIGMGSLLRRAIMAVYFSNIRILFSADLTDKSRLVFRRQILERARTLAPFLTYDADPYPVISNGRIYWIMDAFTELNNYPYSTPADRGVSYIRNSVKVIVDAYDGDINFYLNDPSDPLIRTYAGIFPGMFKPLDSMPQDLRAHLRYPRAMFELQAKAYLRYHMTDEQVFYNQEDLWAIPSQMHSPDQSDVMEPYYTIMKFPASGAADDKNLKEEYILMLPLTPSGKDNMIAWMAARSDAPHSGEMLVYRFPKDTLIYGPMQIEARINQDSYISQQFSLWSRSGTNVIRGSLMVIPVKNSLLYVEPVYLQAEIGKIPELRRVIASCGDKVAMGATLDEAIAGVLGIARTAKNAPMENPAPAGRDGLKRANELLKTALERQRSGDWAGYGAAINELSKMLDRLAS